MVISHHGRPIKVDLDSSETLRCPLLSFPRLLVHGSADLVEHQCPSPCRTEEERYDDHSEDDDDHAVKPTPESVNGQPAGDDGNNRHHDGGRTTKRVPSMTPQTQNNLPARSTAVAVAIAVGSGSETPDDDDDNDGEGVLGEIGRKDPQMLDCGVGGEHMHRPSTGVVAESGSAASRDAHKIPGNVHGKQQHHHLNQPQPQQHYYWQHHGNLVPAQLVAVLVDGSGKGWMAARRLWSVGEVGPQALSEAGLSGRDVDVDQEVSQHVHHSRGCGPDGL